MDGLHEDIDITRRRGTVVRVMGVLVHVEHENQPPAGERRSVVGSPLIDQPFVSRRIREDPELRGKPVAVGGSRERGVVDAASYEARKFGVRSAMPSVTAKRQCPDLTFVKPRFEVYKDILRWPRNSWDADSVSTAWSRSARRSGTRQQNRLQAQRKAPSNCR
jgi:hypothetical protein